MSITLKQVSNNSWIASKMGNPIALVCEQEEKVIVLTNDGRKEYHTMDEAKNSIGDNISESVTGNEAFANTNINGYPVKHDKYTVDVEGERPVYIRGKSTKHCAGYWGIKFNKRYIQSFCPLLKTIEQYSTIGPFKTRIEMMDAMKEANQLINDNE